VESRLLRDEETVKAGKSLSKDVDMSRYVDERAVRKEKASGVSEGTGARGFGVSGEFESLTRRFDARVRKFLDVFRVDLDRLKSGTARYFVDSIRQRLSRDFSESLEGIKTGLEDLFGDLTEPEAYVEMMGKVGSDLIDCVDPHEKGADRAGPAG
jgi:hypothetical protein